LSVSKSSEMFDGLFMENRLKKIRQSRKLSQEKLAQMIGTTNQQIGKLERGDRRLSDRWIYPLAEALGVAPSDLLENPEPAKVTLVGTVAAGKWQSADDVPPPVNMTGVPLSKHLNLSIPRYGYRVVGESMNELYPDGSIVIAIDNIQANHDPQPGDRVIVRRRRLDGTVEFTVKELKVDDDGGKWLIPRSSDPRHQTAFRAVCDDTLDGDDTAVMVGTIVQHLRPPK